eukprot:SAG11_NODE_101_length_16738_cov_8.254703_8_plen_71_part_00
MNLSELGLTTAAEIEEWAARQPRMEAAMKAGSLCVFHGALLRRIAPRIIPSTSKTIVFRQRVALLPRRHH